MERAVFEGEEKKKQIVPAIVPDSRKRKRGDESSSVDEEIVEVRTWDRDLRRSGATAVLVFIDKISSEASLKAVANVAKNKKTVKAFWGERLSEERNVPALGISRMTPDPICLIALALIFCFPKAT